MSENKEESKMSQSELDGKESEKEFREREIAVKEAELALHRKEQAQTGWSSPLVVAIFAAGLGAAGNAGVTYFTGVQQRELEAQRSEQARLLETIRTGDTEKAAGNLKFLVDTGLLSEPHLLASITRFLASRKPGTGPVLPAPGVNAAASSLLSESDRNGVQRAYLTLSRCLATAQALLQTLGANSAHPEVAMALAGDVTKSLAQLSAEMSDWVNGSVKASVPTPATLDSLNQLDARLRAVNSGDEAAVLELAAQLQKAVESVHLFGQ